MVRLFALLALAASTLVSASIVPGTGPGANLDARDSTSPVEERTWWPPRGSTGCTCEGYQVNGKWLLFRTQTGWCWKNGRMTDQHRALVSDAIQSGSEGPPVNGVLARELCDAAGRGGDCVEYIIDLVTRKNGDFVTCSYPRRGPFTPTTCQCGWECDAPYVKCGNSCVRPGWCPSGRATKRDANTAICPAGHSACPTPNGKSTECLDTSSNLEACGGCPGSDNSVDCSALPGVHNVACVKGKCVASACRAGHTLLDGSCVRGVSVQSPF